MSATSYRPVALRMYRILMKQCRTLRHASSSDAILFQTPLDPRANGMSHLFTHRESINDVQARESFYRFLAAYDSAEDDDLLLYDWLEELLDGWYHTLGIPPPQSLWSNLSVAQDSIRYAYRHGPSVANTAMYTSWAIRLFRLLQDQTVLQQTTSISREHDVRVISTSQCIGRTHHVNPRATARRLRGQSMAEANDDDDDDDDLLAPKFRFAYRIRIENISATDTIQLLGRTWNIQETSPKGVALGAPIRVHAPRTGAVGKLPVLHPSQVFEYSSQCELVTPTGEMKGSFYFCGKVPPTTMSSQVGVQVDAFDRPEDCFEVTVQPFRLLADEPSSDL